MSYEVEDIDLIYGTFAIERYDNDDWGPRADLYRWRIVALTHDGHKTDTICKGMYEVEARRVCAAMNYCFGIGVETLEAGRAVEVSK